MLCSPTFDLTTRVANGSNARLSGFKRLSALPSASATEMAVPQSGDLESQKALASNRRPDLNGDARGSSLADRCQSVDQSHAGCRFFPDCPKVPLLFKRELVTYNES